MYQKTVGMFVGCIWYDTGIILWELLENEGTMSELYVYETL